MKNEIEQKPSVLNDSTFVVQKIDIEKELKEFELPKSKDPVPVSNCRVLLAFKF